MPSSKANPRSSDERTAPLTVLAAYAEDFRAAIVEEIALQSTFVRSDRMRAVELEVFRYDAKAASRREDARHSMGLLAGDAALLERIGPEGTAELRITVANHEEAGAVAAALETMTRKVVGRPIKRSLSYSPIDEKAAPGLVELPERLTWTVEAAAGMNRIAIKAREED
jgi:hypothetical protein